jgi:hypothetical protein
MPTGYKSVFKGRRYFLFPPKAVSCNYSIARLPNYFTAEVPREKKAAKQLSYFFSYCAILNIYIDQVHH